MDGALLACAEHERVKYKTVNVTETTSWFGNATGERGLRRTNGAHRQKVVVIFKGPSSHDAAIPEGRSGLSVDLFRCALLRRGCF